MAAQSAPQQFDKLAAWTRHLEALVCADEHHDGVGMIVADLVHGALSPVDEDALGDSGPDVGIANYLHPVRCQRLGEVEVQGLRHRIAGDKQRVEPASRSSLLADLGRIEGVGGYGAGLLRLRRKSRRQEIRRAR